MQETSSDTTDAKAGIIAINGLSYKLAPDLSIVTSRTDTRQYFSQNQYAPNSTAVCLLNTGSSFVFGPNCSLQFTVKNEGANTQGFGIGSAVNLIRRISLVSRSGDVLERIQNLNCLNVIKLWHQHDEHWRDSTGAMMGISSSIPTNGELRFSIPMSELSGLFSYQYLLPSALCSGLRVEIEWESAGIAFATGAGPSYSISDISLLCDSYNLTDMVLQTLNQQASSTGLEIVFETQFDTQASRTNGTIAVESRKAVSRYTHNTPYTTHTHSHTHNNTRANTQQHTLITLIPHTGLWVRSTRSE
jgi:hypothetical protein